MLVPVQSNTATPRPILSQPLRHLWLELTRRCNLQCIHCYASAGPNQPVSEGLTTADWLQLLRAARAQGCSSIQFIGGEPLLHPDLELLLRTARTLEYENIEVFTNGTHITPKWVQLFAELKVKLALSFYATSAGDHEAITGVPTSFRQTLRGIDLAVAAGLQVRVGIIQVNQTDEEVQHTKELLASHAVTDVGVDSMRAVGRADSGSSFQQPMDQLAELCGSCSNGTLWVTSSGEAYPCTMARSWIVGHLQEGLSSIIEGQRLAAFREQQHIHLANRVEPSSGPGVCKPKEGPCVPGCVPPCRPWQLGASA